MYKGFTKMDISEVFTKDLNVKGTTGPVGKTMMYYDTVGSSSHTGW